MAELIIRVKVSDDLDPALTDPEDLAADIIDTFTEDLRHRLSTDIGGVELASAEWAPAKITLPEQPEVNGVPVGSKFSDPIGEYEVVGSPVWVEDAGCYKQHVRSPHGYVAPITVDALRMSLRKAK